MMYSRLLLREFLPFLFIGVLFFGLILILGDIFTNLWRYLTRDVPFGEAIKVSLLYGPKAISFALPIGAMFAAAFALGNLGARNELIAVFGSGVNLFRFVLPILAVAGLLCVGEFLMEDRLAIPMLKKRSKLSRELLGTHDSMNRSQAAAISRGGEVVYYADYYDDESQTLTGLTVVQIDQNGTFKKRIDADAARWDAEAMIWAMESCRVFVGTEGGEISQERHSVYQDEKVNEEPATFRLDTRELDEMNNREARQWINNQRRTGLPYRALQSGYYQRFTFALTPFLVVFFAGALGGRFRRNILLMSLLASLGLSAAWYIVRMIANLLAETGAITPLVGAVVPYLAFLVLGIWLFKNART